MRGFIEPINRGHSAFPIQETHSVLGTPLQSPEGEELLVGMGCFWGAERIFWQLPGIITTSVGYAGGKTTFPMYEEVCTGKTGHAEVVRVNYDATRISDEQIIQHFFENHDPTQGNRQGNDIGSQYRSALYYSTITQHEIALNIRDRYSGELESRGYASITTEIAPLGAYYFAEPYHQQYLYKVPNGYCGIGGTGVACPLPTKDGK